MAQKFTINGRVNDAETSLPLGYANIRVMNTLTGTAANIEGEYELLLDKGDYLLIASFIGYFSDTVKVVLNKDIEELNFFLKRTEIFLPEIVVAPGENPAISIIEKAVKKKEERNKKLFAYEFNAYTKGLVRTKEELYQEGGGIGMGSAGGDSVESKITAIFENESKGYFRKPDYYKEIITAQKQSANFPSSFNTLTGGRIIQNFYDDDVNFFGLGLPGPLASNTLDYYQFYLDKTTAIDSRKVFKIDMYPQDKDNPGFTGSIFITDSTYDLIKVDLQLNDAANVGSLFDTISVVQQFADYNDIFMPVDYHLFLKANYIGLVKFGFEINSILYNYKINTAIDDDLFSKAIITVLPEADKKDSLYWNSIQSIPNTLEEELAYSRIDSLSNLPRSFWDRFSFLDTRTYLNKNFAVSGPLSLYKFNRIEGHSLNFSFYLDDALNRRLNSRLGFSYGFSDKKFKTDFYAKYFLGSYRTYSIEVNAYKKLDILFGSSDNYTDLTSTLIALLFKKEFRDYYYTNGFDITFTGEVTPVLDLSIGYINRTDHTASNKSEFSFFNKGDVYRMNPAVNEGKVNAVKAGFYLDFRDYVEDGYFRRRTSQGGSFVVFFGDVTHSDRELLGSGYDFTTYKLQSRGFVQTFRTAYFFFNAFGMYNRGALPYQNLYSLPGNINYISKSLSFRTLDVNEIIGEKVIAVNVEHQFRDELFKLLKVPGLKDWEITFGLFLNMALSDINAETESILPSSVNKLPHPFYEVGFGIGQGLLPLKIEFAWKLNYRGENNFRVSLNAIVF